jgi:hypothetical protein
MPQWLYTAGPNGHWVFLLVTVVLGGLAAVATGRALAETWRPWWHLPLAMILVTCGVRFVHYAVFEEVMLSIRNFAVDFVVLTAFAAAAYVWTRQRQMARQYGWLAG